MTQVDAAERHINISIDHQHYSVDHEQITGSELLALAGIPAGNQLFEEIPGPDDDPPIGANDTIQLHNGEKFYTVPVGNFG